MILFVRSSSYPSYQLMFSHKLQDLLRFNTLTWIVIVLKRFSLVRSSTTLPVILSLDKNIGTRVESVARLVRLSDTHSWPLLSTMGKWCSVNGLYGGGGAPSMFAAPWGRQPSIVSL